MTQRQKRRQRTSSAYLAAAAFNLPVMIIAGLIIGYLLSYNQTSPQREIIIIGSVLIFFVIAMIELYYVVIKEQFPSYRSKHDSKGLRKLIADYEEE
jgi:Na+/melibiose symporter-like transporter